VHDDDLANSASYDDSPPQNSMPSSFDQKSISITDDEDEETITGKQSTEGGEATADEDLFQFDSNLNGYNLL